MPLRRDRQDSLGLCKILCAGIGVFILFSLSPGVSNAQEAGDGVIQRLRLLEAKLEALSREVRANDQKTLKQAEDSRAELEGRIQSLKSGTDTVPGSGNGESGRCPQGSYMVGARWDNTRGGPHGIIASFAPICRTMGP